METFKKGDRVRELDGKRFGIVKSSNSTHVFVQEPGVYGLHALRPEKIVKISS